jgi:uncharacterized membrane protein
MVSIKISESIFTTPENVFSFVSNFEKAPQYSTYWKSVKLLNREGNSATYETVAQAEGKKIASVTKITSQRNERMDAETIEGDGKGTKLAFQFQRIPSGTQITLEGDIVLPGFAKIVGSLMKGRIESGMREELKIIKSTLEKS